MSTSGEDQPELTESGIEIDVDESLYVDDDQTLVMEHVPAAEEEEPGKGPGTLVDPMPLVELRICERLGQYLGTELDSNEYFPMMEWDLSVAGKLSEGDILQAYHLGTKIAVADEDDLDRVERFSGLTVEYLNEWLAVPLTWDAESVVLVAAYPWRMSEIAYQWRHLMGGRDAKFLLAQRSHVERLITGLYEQSEADEAGLLLDGDASEEALRDLALEAPIVRLVNDMFARAVELGASDIHVEPAEETLAIRFRVDGLLQTVMTPAANTFAAIASRLKLIGGLNIAERRLPQDGRTALQIGRAQIDIRISTLPALHGESIVLRILRKDITAFTLENVGMQAKMRNSFSQLVGLPHGMILVVGPTGSGKTTTLYCVMNLLASDQKKIITIEDPIEYQMIGVTQIQVKPSIGLTFASGLRSIVRQDPDIILVGEIRDKETAEIAIHSALTGHLVLSTLHTNDATGAISRLQDMGVENFLISTALVGVMSQRLVRKICSSCKGEGESAGVRCRTCNGSGFKGRVGIFEYLRMDDDIRRLITAGSDNATLGQEARKKGMRSLREDGEDKADQGVTTHAEVARVCQLDVG